MMKTFLSCRDEFLGLVLKIMLFLTLFFSQQSKAQCPTGDVVLHNEYDLEQFWMNYPNCTHIPGVLQLGNLFDDYSQNTTVAGPIVNNSIYFYLSQIESVGGLKIYNTLLTDVHYFENLTNINGVLEISGNKYITNLYGFRNVDPEGITNLILQSNNSLYSCSNDMICAYMNGSGPRTVSGNQSPCNSDTSLATICLPPCSLPTNVTSSNIASNGAKISWTSSGTTFDLVWGIEGFTPVIGTENQQFGVSGLEYQITGLSESTTYDVWIRQNCSVNESDWVKHTFTTIQACPSGGVYLYSQQDINDFALNYPNCQNLSNTTLQIGPHSNNINNLSPLSNIQSVKDLYIYSTNLTNLNDLSISTIVNRLEIISNSSLTDISKLNDVNFQSLTNLYIYNNGNLSNCNISSLCAQIGNNDVTKLIFNNASGCNSYEEAFGICFPCFAPPANVSSSGIVSNKATLNWTSPGNLFDLEWGPLDFTQGTGSSQNGISTQNYTITNLQPSTTYDVYIRTNCSSTQSNWIKYTFTTPAVCPTGDVYYTTQAEIDNFIATYPNCTQIGGKLQLGVDLSTPNNINNVSAFSNIVSVGGDLIIYSSQLTNLNGFSSITSIAGHLDISKNSQLIDISGVQNINIAGITHLYIEQNTSLSSCNIENVCSYIQIPENYRLIYGNATGCENSEAVVYDCIPPCELPSNITVSNILANKATINWTNSGTFEIEWGIAGFTPGNGTLLNDISGLNYQLTGLYESTSYDVYIRKNCGVKQSQWIKQTFTTIACLGPQSITTSNTTSDKAQINWTNSGVFDLEWGIAGFTQGTGTSEIGVSGDNYLITGLSAQTSYDVYIRQNCSTSNSNWIKFTFSTISVCPSGNLQLVTQQQINDFGEIYPSCTHIQGNVTIDGQYSNINNLGPLSNILSISQYLIIKNTGVYNLNGLSSLTSNLSSLEISNNNSLNDISGLANLGTISNLTITGNSNLSVCHIETVCNYLNGVGQFYAYINGNAEGCQDIDVVKSFCPEAPVLDCPTGNITLTSQHAVNQFSLYNCTTIQGNLGIADSVTDLSPLNSIQTITGDLNISSTQLTSINGLSSLISVGGNLTMLLNNQLTNLGGFSSLTNIGAGISLGWNPQLITLDGFSSLESINGLLSLYENIQLNDISALTNLNGIQSITIMNNYSLSECDITSICNYLHHGGVASISTNGAQCQSDAQVMSFCPPACEEPTELTTTDIISDKATINWGNTGNYDIEWGPEGFIQGEGTLVNNYNGDNYTLTDLSPLTSYDVYIRQDCTYDITDWVKITFSTIAVCPPSYIAFDTQAKLDDYKINYPNCTNYPHTLYISENSSLIDDLSAFENLESINGWLIIGGVDVFDLDVFSNLTSMNGEIHIYTNHNLSDISGLSNIDISGITGLYINSNVNLNVCNLENFCNYLSNNGISSIYANHSDCISKNAILESCEPIYPQSCNGNVTLNTQLAVNAFLVDNPNCTHISGDLIISGNGINNLAPLSNITSVGGYLLVEETLLLNNLQGLNSLTSVGGELTLRNNENLNYIGDLSSIAQVNNLYIIDNPSLINIDIFQSLTSIEGYVYIGSNDALQNVNGLSGLTNVGIDLTISENKLITDLNALSNIESIGGSLYISYNELLEDIDGLSNLTNIGSDLNISGNDLIENLDALSNLVNFEGYIYINENLNLSDITALASIDHTSIYYIEIVDNPSLSVCNLENFCNYFSDFSNPREVYGNAEGCEDIFEVYAACDIEAPLCPIESIYFYSQEDIDNYGLLYPNCTELPFTLYVDGEDITDLSAFNNLTSIYGSIFIENTGLQNLDGLSGLTSISGEIGIINNSILTSIYGLNGIDPESVYYEYWGLEIYDNPQLSICNIESLCYYLSNYQDEIYIYNNAEGCSEVDINNFCGIFCPFGDIEFNSQEDIYDFAEIHPNCTEIHGSLYISAWSIIDDISPLSNIQTINGGLSIGGTNLTNLNDFSNLTTIYGGWISFYDNEYLEDISGLSNVDLSHLTPIMDYDGIYIAENPLLSVCNLPNFCEYLSNDPYTHPRTMYNNAEGCQDQEAVAIACLEPFPCLAPVGINDMTTSNKAIISWSSIGNSFDVEWGFVDFELGEGLGMQYDIAELNFTITNLEEETEYDFYIRRNCLDTDSYSDWIKYSFSTIGICPSNNLYVYSQQDVDDFGTTYPDCTHISGNLVFDSWNSDDPITDLSPMSSIESVAGDLHILETQLANLDGLSSIISIDGDLVIYGNPQLSDISGLQNISEGIYDLYIGYNETLSECNISSICTYLQQGGGSTIQYNAEGCQDYEEVFYSCPLPECPYGGVGLYSQADVDDFATYYPNCTSLEGGLEISGDDITDLSALSNIESISGYFTINQTVQITNLDFLSSLTSFEGSISIYENQGLTDIFALQNIDYTTIVLLQIYQNPMLSACNLPNFCTYLSYGVDFYIENNLGDCNSAGKILVACSNSTCDDATVRIHDSYWTNDLPDSSTKAYISSDYYVYDTLYACEIEIVGNGRLIITPQGNVIVNGIIINNATEENLIVESGGDLVQITDVQNQGPIKVEQVTWLKRLDYTLWSSPVEGMKLKDFSDVSPSGGAGTLWNRVYTFGDNVWDQVWESQADYLADNTSTFEAAKGYFYRSRNDFHPTNLQQFKGVFAGVPHNGYITINVPFEFNAIGNPYPSAISADDVLASGASALYFWTNTNAPDQDGNYVYNNWATYSAAGGTTATNGGQVPNGIIQTTQGFIVGFDEANPSRTISFNNEMRLATNNSQFFRQMSNERHRFWLNLTHEEVIYNQILIGYIENASQGVDSGIDAKMFAYEGNAIYSVIENSQEQYVIQGRELPFTDSDVVKLGFRAIHSGSFSISLNNFDGIFEQENLVIYLKDNFNQTQHNLKNGAYTFLSEEGIFDDRFEVVYQTTLSTETPISTDANWIVYRQDKGFQVQSIGFEMKEVSVYDILGRGVYTSKAEGTSHHIPALGAEGVFIVKVTTTDDKVLNKKVR